MIIHISQMMFLYLIVLFLNSVNAHIGYSTQSYCLDQIPSSTLNLICPNNQLVKLGRIIYGYSWSNDCSYIDKDCTMDVPREDIICLTTNNCTVRVVEHPLILQDCWNLAATYVQAEYECVRDYSMENLCQSKDIIGKNGFLSTPNYPHGFSSNLNCPCVLIASPGHSIILEIIDFHLPICAEAGLILWLGQDFQTKCLIQDPVTLISQYQQNITLRFYSLKNHKQGGVLMKYSVSPESDNGTVRLQCLSESSSTVSRSIIGHNSSNLKTSSLMSNIIDQTDSIDISMNDDSDSSRSLRPISSNQSIQKKNVTTNTSRSNVTLSVIFIITIVIFLIIINVLVWFMCSARWKKSQSSTSAQDLFAHQAYLNNELKTSHRLKTLHALLYATPKGSDTEPIRRLDSILSENPLHSNPSHSNLNHGFIFKSKSNSKLHEPRQINSWDDI